MLFTSIDDLKIRNKLIVFLIIPILTILYFSISGIYSKYQEQKNASQLQDFIVVSSQFQELIHVLQSERGLTAGLAENVSEIEHQKLHQALHQKSRQQRQLTYEKLSIFLSKINMKDPSEKYRDVLAMLERLQIKLRDVSDIDVSVDRSFGVYSDIISLAISITEQIQLISNDIIFARKGDAYTSLLLLEELFAKERGLINAIIASSRLNTERIKKISSYMSGQQKMMSHFNSVATNEQKVLLLEKMKHPVVTSVNESRIAILHKASRNDELNSLLNLIGYGGLIHDFKNYVFRGKQRYAVRFNRKYTEIINIIKIYQELPGMSNKEIHALNTIKQTFRKYKSMLAIASNLRKEGKSFSEIDIVVKIDDKPALDAIHFLHKNITGLNTDTWWDKASTQIKLIRDVTDVVRADMIEHSNQHLKATSNILFVYITLTLISLLVSFYLGFRILHRLVDGIVNIESHMSKMSESGEFDILLKVSGQDEISRVAQSFNNLISERSKYEAQLRLAAMVFEKSSEAMVVTDANNQFISINPSFSKITGYSIEDIKGSTPAILQSGKQDKNFYKKLWSSLHDKGYWSGELYNRRKNGEIYPEWLNINVIKDNEGNITRHIAMFSDISERKKLEDEIFSSEQHLHLYRDQAPMATIEWSTDFQVISWNKAAEKMFGYSVDEVRGLKFVDVMLPESAIVDVKKIWKDLMAQTGGEVSINENLTKDGRTILCEWHNTPLKDELGNVIGAASIVQDITERKQQEEQIRRSQKMDALGKLTGGIAHDYNNMLGVVLGYAELLNITLADQPKLAGYVEQIEHAGQRGAKLTSKLLSFSSNTSSELKELNINVLLQNEKLMLEKTLTARISLVLDLEEDLYSVMLDENEFEDVLLNMSINAMHAIEGNGRLTLKTRSINLDEKDGYRLNLHQGDYILLSITDTGSGMTLETKEKLFDPFYSTKGDKGTGLGLSQVYNFVKNSGGVIEVDSEVGKGAEFRMYFPKFVGNKQIEKRIENNNGIDLSGTETVLIVDDEPALLAMCSVILEGKGYKVLCAESAKQALEILELKSVDLLLSDVIMPEMDGYTLAEIVQNKFPNIKIQMVSGFTDIHHLKVSNKSLHKNLIFKPYQAQELLSKIRVLLG